MTKKKPNKLYKYKSLSGDSFKHTQAIVLHDEIYFPNREKLNDPFEALFKVYIPSILPQTIIPAKGGILSLSKKPDDILLWSHYADSHQGVCLEFDTRISDSPFAMARPVDYRDNYCSLCFDENYDSEKITEMVCLTKSKDWKYENEWRVIGSASGTIKFPAESLTGVIIGSKISQRNLKSVESWVNQRNKPVTLYKTIQNPNSFSLKIIEVSLSSQ